MSSILHRLTFILACVSFLLTTYLYQYPLFHRCSFPTPNVYQDGQSSLWSHFKYQFSALKSTSNSQAPFRLLALGDPQLEGDTSLPDPKISHVISLRLLATDILTAESFRKRLDVLQNAVSDLLLRDLLSIFKRYRKQLDLFGNDYYLAHIYRTIHQHTNPTHVTVLGDLLGSQWIDDEEFERRGVRFWQRVFRHGRKVEEEVMAKPTVEILREDKRWTRRIINIAGNHDVGYAGDMTADQVERFTKVFGRPNWEIRFRLRRENPDNDTEDHKNKALELRIVILNSLNLDTPALDQDLQWGTYDFINEVITRSNPVEDRRTGTILLTHIPLHKESGVCVDSPFFDFYSNDQGGGVKEQNHISYEAGKGLLEGIFGMSGNLNAPGQGFGRNGIILTGHDHEGCDVYHHLSADEDGNARRWKATRWRDAADVLNQSIPGVREITVRSMMGDFGGNAGLLSAWFDYDAGEWHFAYSNCSIGVQHIWWAVHVLLLVTLGLFGFVFLGKGLDTSSALRAGNGLLEKNPIYGGPCK